METTLKRFWNTKFLLALFLNLGIAFSTQAQTTCNLNVISETAQAQGGNIYTVTVYFEVVPNSLFTISDANSIDSSDTKCFNMADDPNESFMTLSYDCGSNYNITLSYQTLINEDCTTVNADECQVNLIGISPIEIIDNGEVVCIRSANDFFQFRLANNNTSRVAALDFPVRSGGKKLVNADVCIKNLLTADFEVRGGCYEFTENPGLLDLNDYLFEPGNGLGTWSNNTVSGPTVSSDGIVDFDGFGFGEYTFTYEGNSFYGECGVSSTEVKITYGESILNPPLQSKTLEVCEIDEIDLDDLSEFIGFDSLDGRWIPNTYNGPGEYAFYTPKDIYNFIDFPETYCNVDSYVVEVVLLEAFVYYVDMDLDGYGVDDALTNIQSCESIVGYSRIKGDCNDNDPNINPGQIEIPDDGIDQNCDPSDDKSVTEYQGCSHGYWKNHNDWCAAYTQNMNFFEVFVINNYQPSLEIYKNYSLQDALEAKGGGYAHLMRDAVAALLNICDPNTNYPYQLDELNSDIRSAFLSKNKKRINTIANKYGDANNLVCPLNIPTIMTENTQVIKQNNVRIYPNPIGENGINIYTKNSSSTTQYRATIYNLQGLEIATTKFATKQANSNYNWPLNTTQWKYGIYVLEVVEGNTKTFIKLVKD